MQGGRQSTFAFARGVFVSCRDLSMSRLEYYDKPKRRARLSKASIVEARAAAAQVSP